jgi:hypothetical protein
MAFAFPLAFVATVIILLVYAVGKYLSDRQLAGLEGERRQYILIWTCIAFMGFVWFKMLTVPVYFLFGSIVTGVFLGLFAAHFAVFPLLVRLAGSLRRWSERPRR